MPTLLSSIRADSLTAKQPASLPEEGGSTPTSALHLNLRPIPHKIAKAFVEKWHYSRRIPTGKNFYFGAYNGEELYAAIVYGIGVNPYQARFLGVESVIEIKRMCRSEPRINFPLSSLIRKTMRMVRRLMPYDAVVAFADPEQGHEGTVYKAAGFVHEGMSSPEWHLVGADGTKRHRRFAFRHARRNNISIADARAALGVTRVKTAPKHRWVVRLEPSHA